MSGGGSKFGAGLGRDGCFGTTHWSIIAAAGGKETPHARKALEALCQSYWYPVYAFIRRQGRSADAAEDLTQEFFTSLLQRNDLGLVDRQCGRFRSWLLASVRHFLANDWDRARAQKRGGGRRLFSFDLAEAEDCYRREPVDGLTPEKLFDRRWALTILAQAIGQVREEAAARGKQHQFDALKPFLAGESPGTSLKAAARGLGMTEGAAYVALHRLRRRCREVLTEAIAQTVNHPDEIQAEVKELFCALE